MRTRHHPILLFAAVLAVLTLAPRPARAENGNFGLGIIIGSPTGLSMKLYLSRGHALDAAVGGTVAGNHGLGVHVDYLWHPAILARESSFDLAFYVGAGVRLLDHNRKNNDDDIHIGPRIPVGLVFDFLRGGIPLDVFVEVAFVLDFVVGDDNDDEGATDVDLNAGIGARYYF